MRYIWLKAHETHKDPDECITKVCHLGPHLLELTETLWQDGKLMMAFNVYKWNDREKGWDSVETNLKPQEYDHKTSHKVLEDWYACNVLLEDYLGNADENKKPESICSCLK